MQGKLIMAATGVGGALVMAACGSASPAARPAARTAALASDRATIVGTWVDTVTPNAPGGKFESTIVFTASGAVVEATSKAFTAPTADTSEGLGVWKSDDESIRTTFQKYRFDATGNYIGKTVVVETEKMQGPNAYNGNAVTTIYSPGGAVLASFTSTTHAIRMHV